MLPGVCPVHCLAKCYRGSFLHTIRIKLYLYRLAFPILVVLILPGLGDRHAGLSRRIGICDVIIPDFCAVFCYCIFRDGISNLLAVLILRKIFKAVCPVAIRIRLHCRVGLFFVIGKQPDRDASRTLPVLVVPVIPGLFTGHSNSHRRIMIRQLTVTVVLNRN